MTLRSFSSERVRQRWRRVEQKILLNSKTLATQGSLASRMSGKRRVWILRFTDQVNECPMQRAIYVGGDDQPEILERVRLLLEHIRAPERFPRELSTYLTFTGRILAILRHRAP